MTGFELGDISVGNGSLGPLTHVSDKVKTAVLTPAADGECTLSVAADKFTDPVGNLNTASNTFTWTFDSVAPTVTIDVNDANDIYTVDTHKHHVDVIGQHRVSSLSFKLVDLYDNVINLEGRNMSFSLVIKQ